MWAIGLDVGGTKIAGGLVALDTGAVTARRVIPTYAERGGRAVLDSVTALAQQLYEEAITRGRIVTGIGTGVPELVNPAGCVTSAYNFDWRDLPVQERLAAVSPAVVDSDVRAAALAEARCGAGKEYDLFAYVTVGTGISYALVQDGSPFMGARGNALLLASMPLTMTCTACGAILNQVLEEFASGPALVARYNAQTGARLTSGKEVMAALTAGDAAAHEIVTSAGQALGNSVGFLANVLDPQAIVVGGGLGLAGGLYWESFVAATRAHIYSTETAVLPIIPAALGVDAGLIGAALLTERLV